MEASAPVKDEDQDGFPGDLSLLDLIVQPP